MGANIDGADRVEIDGRLWRVAVTRQPVGALFLAGYVAAIGAATYLMNVSLRDLSAYQVNLLMAVAMLALSAPAVWVADRTFRMSAHDAGLGAVVAVLMAIGSIFYALALDRLLPARLQPSRPATWSSSSCSRPSSLTSVSTS